MSKIALVTGGGSGIGKACALRLAENDYTVVVTGRGQDALDQTVAAMGSGHGFAYDVTDAAQVDALFAKITDKLGRLDVLFNNAGNNVPAAPIGDIPPENFLKVMNVNLYGAFLCARKTHRADVSSIMARFQPPCRDPALHLTQAQNMRSRG